jgi:uncharacterized membrane protein YidH (DUF202 family)
MKTIGAILIIVGFLLGVLGGIRFSSRNAIISDSGNNVDQSKQMQVSLMASLAVLMVLGGVYLFFS